MFCCCLRYDIKEAWSKLIDGKNISRSHTSTTQHTLRIHKVVNKAKKRTILLLPMLPCWVNAKFHPCYPERDSIGRLVMYIWFQWIFECFSPKETLTVTAQRSVAFMQRLPQPTDCRLTVFLRNRSSTYCLF